MTGVEDDEPVSIIFLSCDLTGSTKFKQRRDLRVPWQKVFLQFYREFPQRVATTRVAMGTTNLDFRLWKPVGDELIYSCVVRSEEDVYNAVRTWLKAMRDYELLSLNDTDMGTKGGAFIATFPGPDSRSSVPRLPQNEVSDDDVVILNMKALDAQDNDAFVYDYFGPSIDTGFRILNKSSARFFTLSVEVALPILARKLAPGSGQIDTNTDDFLLLDFVELKGVWENQRYPIVAIDTQYEDRVHQAYRKFEQHDRTGAPELHELCEACYQTDNWPSKIYLPNAGVDYYKDRPVDPLKDYIAMTSEGAEEIADEPEGASSDLGEDVDLGVPRKREISVGFVSGDDRIHGYVPDGSVLCEALGDDFSDPYSPPDSCNMPDDSSQDFNPSEENACSECSAIFYDLPD